MGLEEQAYSTKAVIVGADLKGKAVIERIITKTNTTITVGQVLYYDTDGYAPATQTIVDSATNAHKFYVAAEGVTAKASTQYYIRAYRKGIVGINATFTNGGAKRGTKVRVSTTAGKVTYHTKPTTVATELYEVGTLYGDIDSGDTGAWVDLGGAD